MSAVPVRFARQVLAVLVALVAALATAVPALGADTHLFQGSFDGSATPAGSFSYPGRMAIDQDADVLYLVDTFNGAIVKFDVSGDPAAPMPADFSALTSPALDGAGSGEADETPQGSLNLGGDSDIAVDNTGGPNDGNVYVASESGYLYAFDSTGAFLYALDGSDPDGPGGVKGTPTGSLDNPCGVAVGSDGSIYVSGFFASVVRKFEPAGSSASYVSGFQTSSPTCHIAVDSSDNVYANHYGAEVKKYNPEGGGLGTVDPGAANAVTVAPNGNVYVDLGDRIREYDPAGTAVSSFGAGKLGWSIGVVAGGSAGSVFASDTSSAQVHVFGPLTSVPEPTVGIDPVTDPTSSSADLSGRVNPQGQSTTARFQVAVSGEVSGSGDPIWTDLPVHDDTTDPDLASSTSDVELTDQATGLAPNTTYDARLVATNAGGETASDTVAFQTDAVAPVVTSRPPDLIRSTKAVIGGDVDPRRAQGEYHVEYSSDPSFPPGLTDRAPATGDAPLPLAGNGTVIKETAAQEISGLTPATTYHYRVVASNAGGTTTGPSASFMTKASPPPPPADCDNARYRVGSSAELRDCRAYEQVSPVDKNGGQVAQDGVYQFAAPDGEAAAFVSFTGFGDSHGSGPGGLVHYASTRKSTGWDTRAVTPLSAPESLQIINAMTKVIGFNDDLTRAVVSGYNLPAAEDDIPLDWNFYGLDVASQALTTIVNPLPGGENPNFFTFGPSGPNSAATVGVSRDARHVTFQTAANLIPGTTGFAPKFYQWDDGALRLAGILPNGTVPVSAGTVRRGVQYLSDTVAPDGSRSVFRSPTTGSSQLYMSKTGGTTAQISQAEGSTPVPTPQLVVFQTASPALENVLFTTASRLTDSDPGGDGVALYRYRDSADPASDANLTFVDRAGDFDVAGLADDATRIYYQVGDTTRIWDDGTVKTIASGGGSQQFGVRSVPRQDARVSPNGRYFVFISEGRHTVTPGSYVGAPCIAKGPDMCRGDIYLYDADSEELTCTSCSVGTDGNAFLYPVDPESGFLNSTVWSPFRPRIVLDDGKVFFSTTAALVPRDVNGKADAYQYDPATGERTLLTTGRSSTHSWFADASVDGEDLFVLTRESLVGWDTDEGSDMYDVRVGGGYPEPLPAIGDCSGDECQNGGSPSPPFDKAGSGDIRGGDGEADTRAAFSLAPVGIGQRRLFARSGRLVLRVRTRGAGRLVVRSNRGRGDIRRVAGPTTERMAVRLDRRARRALRARGRLKVRIVVTFNGQRRTVTLTLRRAK